MAFLRCPSLLFKHIVFPKTSHPALLAMRCIASSPLPGPSPAGSNKGSPSVKEDKKPLIHATVDDFNENNDMKISIRDKLKLLARDYGSTVFVVHITISLMSLGICYTIVSAGLPIEFFMKLVSPVIQDHDEFMKSVAVGSGSFAIAYVFHKCLMPFRIALTAASTPVLVRFLRSRGILKPHVPPIKTEIVKKI